MQAVDKTSKTVLDFFSVWSGKAYECGMVPKEEAKGRYPVRFATVAMLFIIFDIEVVFMYPWAVSLDQLKLFGLIEMLVFIFILGIAYVYIWGRGGLEWD